jgi:hypothetical protein
MIQNMEYAHIHARVVCGKSLKIAAADQITIMNGIFVEFLLVSHYVTKIMKN